MNRSKKKSFDWYGARQRFSIRKYHIGAASVLLGTTLVLGTGTIVGAETGVNGDGASNGQIVPGNGTGTSDGTQPQGDNQGDNSSGVQTGNTTNSTANVQPANDTGSESGQPVVNPRTMALTPVGDGSTNQPVDEPVIKFPTTVNDPVPEGYVTVTFNKSPWDKGLTLGNQSGNSVRIFVKNDVTWATLLSDPAWQWPTVTTDSGDTVVGWAVNISYGKPYNKENAFARDKYKDTVVTDTKLSPNVVYEVEDVIRGNGTKEDFLSQYGPDEQNKWIFIKFDAGQGRLSGSKQSKMVAVSNNLYPIEFDNSLFTKKVESPTLDGSTFVRWQTEDGFVLPKSGIITTEATYEALYLAHPQNQVAVFDSKKLTDSEKEQVKKNILDANPNLSTGVPQVIKAIEISATGEATVTFDDGTAVKVPSATLTNEDKATARSNAKAEIEKDAMEKSAAINASNLTEEEKRAKLAEVDNAKAAADSAIDRANTSDELNTALNNGKTEIGNVPVTSQGKAAALAELQSAKEAKLQAIENSALTAEEKSAATQVVNDKYTTAESNINNATTNDAVTQALNNGKTEIGNVSLTSQGKVAALAELQSAKEAKLQAIENSALTAEEKSAATQVVNDKYTTAESNINNATTNDAVTQALNNGKTEIGNVSLTSQGKAAALAELQSAKEAKLQAIENSSLTDEEKSAKQAELDKAKADADKAINAATDNAGVAKALEDGKKAIAGIDTSTSAKKAQAKEDLETAYNAKKDAITNSGLTAEEKDAKQAELDKAKADADKAIDTATDNAGVAKALEDGKSAIAGIDTSTSAKKDQAKEELKAAADDAKKAIEANDNLTDAEKQAAKKAVDDEVAKANDAIDAATKADEVEAATLAGEKAVAKQALEKAYNAKKEEIAKSSLTAEEKSAKQAELDQAKSAADSAIDVATDNTGVAKALEAGKVAIDAINTSTSAGIDTSTSAKKAQAKKDLEAAYNAKKAEIENSALTTDEKAAKQAELDKAKADADKAIDAATDASGVAKALEDGKSAIDAINTTTSAEKAAAKKDLEDAYNAKKAEIENSALTADEKAAKQAELDKVKADADRAIDAATDDAGVAKALEDGKAAIDAINTTTSAGIDTSSSAKKAHKENKVLPKTGDNVGLSSVLGIAGLALLGTAIRKKRED
ncbi:DUF1542 domain-containing protein [Streptococcus suis]|nr:DUF1542 domain-containing protein [Streptococcus suis]